MSTDEILRLNLTTEQYKAVVDESKNILCLACAGSGKSRTLAYKIAYLMSRGEAPESIVAFTFTEKAAESIKRRVAEALRKVGLPENYIGAMFIGTLDSFCQKLLGNINARYRQYDILDQNGLVLFIMSRYYRLGLNEVEGKYFDNIKNLAEAWQTANNENIAIGDIGQYDVQLVELLQKLNEALLHDGYMDFSYAIRLATEELKKIGNKQGSAIEKYKFLFVDEYQDINPVQEEFIKTFSQHLNMLFVVGDDDQAIYGWRGANVQNILSFKDRYSGVSVHELLVNFRSIKTIVDVANSFVQNTLVYERMPKQISSGAKGNIQEFRNLWFENRSEEANWIAQRIKSLVGTTYIEYNPDGSEKSRRGLTYSDFVILLRGIRHEQGENRDVEFVNALRAQGIPVKTTGEGGIFDRPYAQAVLQTMELLRSSENGRKEAEEIFVASILPSFPQADKSRFLQVLQKWHHEIYAPHDGARRKVYPQRFLHDIIDALMLRSMNDEMALRDLGLYSKIILDVEQIYISIDSPGRYREMLNYLQNIAKNNYELEPIDYISKDNAVNISTIHRVKGLEFPVVFVADLITLRFPRSKSQYRGVLPAELMNDAISRGAYGTRIQDEARLFYTAITRAERLLYLSGSAWYPGLKRTKKQSSFSAGLTHDDMRTDKQIDEFEDKMEPMARFDDADFPTDYSSVKGYMVCPYSYKLSTIYGYNAAVPELFGFGKTSHTTLEKLHQDFKDRVPTEQEVNDIVEKTFMLKHVFQSSDPINRPGSYERAKSLLQRILVEYAKEYATDFGRLRQDEARFEIAVKDALVTGAIDLLLQEEPEKGIITADVIDFKTMELPDKPEDMEQYDWRDMSIQVQLYSKAAKEIMGENVETGYIHTLKDNKRTPIPVDDESVDNAIKNIEWAVNGILSNDFPMRACKNSCEKCDYGAMCAKKREPFMRSEVPPTINTPSGQKMIAALEEES